MNLGKLIEAYMRQENLSYRQLGPKMEVDWSNLRRVVKGQPTRAETTLKILVWMLKKEVA